MVNTYKHYWYICRMCEDAFRLRKERYLINWLPRFLLRIQPKLAHFLPDSSVIEDSSRVYDYMATEEHVRHDEKVNAFENFLTTLVDKHGVRFNGKSVLDISGGNGSFAKKLQGLAEAVTMTEFNLPSVEYARKHYEIEAVRFDFQSNSINEILEKKFDIVLLRAAIMFCLDVPKFVKDLKRILHPNAQVYLEVVPPTLGVFLRWQFDDHFYLRLYNTKTIVNIFEGEGFKLVSRSDNPSVNYLEDFSIAMKLAQLAYALPASLMSLSWNHRIYNPNLLFNFDSHKS